MSETLIKFISLAGQKYGDLNNKLKVIKLAERAGKAIERGPGSSVCFGAGMPETTMLLLMI